MSGLIYGDFSHAVPSFRTNISVPSTDPDSGVLVRFCFNRDYKPYLLGALSQLYLESTWRGSGEDKATAIERMKKFAGIINDTEFCNVGDSGVATYDFTIDNRGWSVVPGFASTYVSGVGWRSEWFEYSPNVWWNTLNIVYELPQPVFVRQYVARGYFNNDFGGVIDGHEFAGGAYSAGFLLTAKSKIAVPDFTQYDVYLEANGKQTGSVATHLYFTAGVLAFYGEPPLPSQHMTITRVDIDFNYTVV